MKYHLLPTFLLEGFQEQQRIIAAQAEELRRQQARIEAQRTDRGLGERLRSIEAMLARPGITTASDSR